jgi:hypothetical protein
MAIPENKVTIQIIVDRSLAEKIDKLAERMETSQSKMGAMLLEAAVEDEGPIIKFVTSDISKRIIRAFRSIKKK